MLSPCEGRKLTPASLKTVKNTDTKLDTIDHVSEDTRCAKIDSYLRGAVRSGSGSSMRSIFFSRHDAHPSPNGWADFCYQYVNDIADVFWGVSFTPNHF